MVVGFDSTVFPRLDYSDPEAFQAMIARIESFFQRHAQDLAGVVERAPRVAAAFDRLDPLIQKYTAKVCPYCGTVCCANKFGFPEFGDVVVFLAMGMEIPEYDLAVDPEALCQFIGEKGCVLPRPRRPYRCTWYFCEPLLLQLEIGPARNYRSFIQDLQELSAARGDLLQEFYRVWLEKGGETRSPAAALLVRGNRQ